MFYPVEKSQVRSAPVIPHFPVETEEFVRRSPSTDTTISIPLSIPGRSESRAISKALALASLWLCVFCVHGNLGSQGSADTNWSLPVAESIVSRGDTAINEFLNPAATRKQRAVVEVSGDTYNFFPLGPSLAATPFIWSLKVAPSITAALLPGIDQEALLRTLNEEGLSKAVRRHRGVLERAISSFYVATASILIFLCFLTTLTTGWATLLTIAFSFGSSALSTASRALWQHSPSLMLLSLALYLLLRLDRTKGSSWALGITMALAYIMRPTNIIPVSTLALYLLIKSPRTFLAYGTAFCATILPWISYNYTTYANALPPYYSGFRLEVHAQYVSAVLGNLVSPARGLLVFTPVLCVGLYYVAKRLYTGKISRLETLLGVTALLHLLSVSLLPHWWGGHSFGSRFMIEALPFLFYLTALGVRRLELNAAFTRYGLLMAVCFGLIIHSAGTSSKSLHRWNNFPKNVDSHPERLWDIADSPISRLAQANLPL